MSPNKLSPADSHVPSPLGALLKPSHNSTESFGIEPTPRPRERSCCESSSDCEIHPTPEEEPSSSAPTPNACSPVPSYHFFFLSSGALSLSEL